MNEDWSKQGARSFTEARSPKVFVRQHVAPLLGKPTRSSKKRTRLTKKTAEDSSLQGEKVFLNEEDFWRDAGSLTFDSVRLNRFRLSDWFPRTPGVYWSRHGIRTREHTYNSPTTLDPKLGRIFSPQSKMSLIEEGGIGTIRLRPRRVEGTDCWFATAVTGSQCAGGIPLLLPHAFIRESSVEWGDTVDVVGTVRFLQDARLDDIAAYVHHASPVMLFVEEIKRYSSRKRSEEHTTITPVALFDLSSSGLDDENRQDSDFGYTFVQSSSNVSHLDDAAGWIELYARKHGGKVLTNFDERSPMLADAPLSYQRLVNKTYDRTVITNLHLEKLADRIDSVTTEYVNYGQVGAMGESARSDGNLFRRWWRGEDPSKK